VLVSIEEKSRAYAAAQSLVFVLFALAVLSNRGPWLIRTAGTARIAGHRARPGRPAPDDRGDRQPPPRHPDRTGAA
jgi:hypothetical protein